MQLQTPVETAATGNSALSALVAIATVVFNRIVHLLYLLCVKCGPPPFGLTPIGLTPIGLPPIGLHPFGLRGQLN